jgi:hypothetical protein
MRAGTTVAFIIVKGNESIVKVNWFLDLPKFARDWDLIV